MAPCSTSCAARTGRRARFAAGSATSSACPSRSAHCTAASRPSTSWPTRSASTAEELRRRRGEITRSDLTSLNTLVMSDDATTIERIDTLASHRRARSTPCTPPHVRGQGKFRDAFAQLPQREREIAVMLYVKNLTLAEIGEVLGVSESRVCQIHGEMKKKLRKTLEADARDPPASSPEAWVSTWPGRAGPGNVGPDHAPGSTPLISSSSSSSTAGR